MWDEQNFSGAKIALLCAGGLIAYKRDQKPEIPFPGMWDLPGGGREGDETPTACALREVREEFGLTIAAERIIWERQYAGRTIGAPPSYFVVAQVTPAELRAIEFGEEGEVWRVMPIQEFLSDPEVVSHLQHRLSDYLAIASQS